MKQLTRKLEAVSNKILPFVFSGIGRQLVPMEINAELLVLEGQRKNSCKEGGVGIASRREKST
ncbi:MAG: hypothetical protein AB2421_16665 [Thermotaleaceae bacterium]